MIVSDTAVWHRAQACPPCRYALGSDPRDPQAEFRTQALLCTDLVADPGRIIGWFVRRWQMETTFQEVPQRLGFETQRHWSERAIRRVAPAPLALFSVRLRCSLTNTWRRTWAASDKRPGTTRGIRPSLMLFGVGTQAVVGAGTDFLRVAFSDLHDKSTAGVP